MSNGAPAARQRNGKLRLRSVPRAFWRVPRATPSGLTVRTSHSWTPAGGVIRRSRATTAWPAVSVPWIDPTTSTRRGAAGSPTRSTSSGAPSAERPNVSAPAAAGREAEQEDEREQDGGGHAASTLASAAGGYGGAPPRGARDAPPLRTAGAAAPAAAPRGAAPTR